MEKDEQKRRNEELDRFWDIDALIPAKRVPRYAADTETTEIVLEPEKQDLSAQREEPIPPAPEEPKRHFIPPHTADEFRNRPVPDEEYTPENALIRTVRLYRWRNNYRYYEGFVRDAVRLHSVTGVECARTPFFSYVPQYSQMSRPQLEWYLWWRECVRNGQFPDTDYSYVLLYAYELINLSDRIAPAEAQESLCNIWLHYRNLYHQLDSYLPEWICDHGLIHHLSPPEICTGKMLGESMSHCTLKEFYVPGAGEMGYLRALLAFCSNYDYHKSKFCVGENIALFDRAVIGALRTVSDSLSEKGKLFSAAGMDDSKMMRDAYTGALCSYRVKRKIEVEYCSFSRTHELRYFITDVVKYTENKLRAVLGVRSRLSIYALPTSVRELLDAFLDELLPKRPITTAKKKEAPAEYEKMYDLPCKELSLSDAAEIERLSWDTTQRLVEAFEEETAGMAMKEECGEPLPAEPVPQTSLESGADGDAWQTAIRPYLPFLLAVRDGDGMGQNTAARTAGLPLDVLADEVNSLAAEHLGDILLEETDGIYTVIEDYREILEDLTPT